MKRYIFRLCLICSTVKLYHTRFLKSPKLYQIRDVLQGLFEKLPADARPIFHSDQGWQYQHAEYQRLLAEHNITQSMSRKGNCMDNGIMENFFGRLKVEMYYGEKFESPMGFIEKLEEVHSLLQQRENLSEIKRNEPG